jgi:hypothetical protein
VIGALVRIYSYLYYLALALLLLGISLVALLSHSHTLNLGMLPWKGTALTYWLLGLGIAGLLAIVLSWIGRLRFMLLLYALAVFVMMVRGYFLSGYSFSGKDEFRMALWMTAGAMLAICGAWSQFRRKAR